MIYYYRQIFICLIVSIFASLILTIESSRASWYESEIEYQQSVTKIVGRGDISWGSKADSYYKFGSVVVSADGSTVLFTGRCQYCDQAEVRPFIVNPDGSNIRDISQMLPSDITTRWSGWRNMTISDDSSKVFFRAVVETGYYDDEYIYSYDLASSKTELAVSIDGGFSPFSSSWLFRIDSTGSTIYLDKFNSGWDQTLKKSKKGLFYAENGSNISWYFDVDTLPCQSYCGDLNMFSLLGVSAKNGRAFFQWNSDYKKTDGKDNHTALYYTDLTGTPTKLSDDHYHIYDGDPRGISDSEGNVVIYRFKHDPQALQKLAVVDVKSNKSKEVAWTKGLNGFSAHLSRSGNYLLVNGEYGDEGTYYQTLIDLKSEKSKDTWSYQMMSRWGTTSNLTEDDRYFFYSIDDTDANSGLYRVDTKSKGGDRAAYVEYISFSAPALLDQDGVTIAVQTKISDPQGAENIEWVKLLPIIEGHEDPSWSMGRVPIAFPSGDAGSTRLYDDGTHGDLLANDGIYTFDSIATRKGDHEGETWNTWYQHYPLPSDLGIRIIVKDRDNNYTISDTTLRITNDPKEVVDSSSNYECTRIDENLNILIPCAIYTTPFSTTYLSLDFEYAEADKGDYFWRLRDFYQIDEPFGYTDSQCSQISATLGVFVPCATISLNSTDMKLWLNFEYDQELNSAALIWRLDGLGEIK
ncbi:MAG: hypothetical protein HQK64_07995 [Desulfamplus sp.]|nr:hypothetical protein [Desulfamplus sp.]